MLQKEYDLLKVGDQLYYHMTRVIRDTRFRLQPVKILVRIEKITPTDIQLLNIDVPYGGMVYMSYDVALRTLELK